MNLRQQYIKERNSNKITYQFLFSFYKEEGYKFKSIEDFITFYSGNDIQILKLYLQYGGKNENIHFDYFLNRIEQLKNIDFTKFDSHFGLAVLEDKEKNFIKVVE